MSLPITLRGAAVNDGELQKVAALAAELQPGSALNTLVTHLLAALGKNMDLTLVLRDQLLTPNEAADLLQMSRPHLLKLIDQGVIVEAPRVGAHRRIEMSALLDYIDRREKARAEVALAVANRRENAARMAQMVSGISDEEKDQFRL